MYFSPAHLTLGDHVAVWWRRFFATNLTIMIMIIKVMTVLVMRMIMITLLAMMMIVVAGVRR